MGSRRCRVPFPLIPGNKKPAEPCINVKTQKAWKAQLFLGFHLKLTRTTVFRYTFNQEK